MKKIFGALIFSMFIFPANAQENIDLNSVMLNTQTGQTAATMHQTGKASDIFSAQKQLVFHVMNKLDIDIDKLPPDVVKSIQKPQTTSIPALVSFSEGVDALDSGNFAEAKKAFSKAASIDPNFQIAVKMQKSMPAFNVKDVVANAVKTKVSGNKKQTVKKQSPKKQAEAKKKAVVNMVASKSSEKAKTVSDKVRKAVEIAGVDEKGVTSLARFIEAGKDNGGAAMFMKGLTEEERAQFAAINTGFHLDTETGVITIVNDQGVVLKFELAELAGLVESGTFTDLQLPDNYNLQGYTTTFLLRNSAGNTVLVDDSYNTNDPFNFGLNYTGQFAPQEQYGEPGKLSQTDMGNDGYLEYDSYGNLVKFVDDADNPNTFQNTDLSVPHQYTGEERIILAGTEFIERGYVSAQPWLADDNTTQYSYLGGKFPVVVGVTAPLLTLADLYANNAVYQYTGDAGGRIAKYDNGSLVSLEDASTGNFNATVNFGTLKVTNMQVSMETDNYGFSFNAAAPLDIEDVYMKTFVDYTGANFMLGDKGSLEDLTEGSSSGKIIGGIFGNSGTGMGGVFSAKRESNDSQEKWVADGAFIGSAQ